MPSLKDLRNRIASVKSTQKITKAMQMVAAAKLRRAQMAAEAARPYAERMEQVLANLAGGIGAGTQAPPLLAGTGHDQTHLLVVCTAERGLCGAFNSLDRRASPASTPTGCMARGQDGQDPLRRQEGLRPAAPPVRAARSSTWSTCAPSSGSASSNADPIGKQDHRHVRGGRVRRLHAVLLALPVGDRADPDGAAADPGRDPGGARPATAPGAAYEYEPDEDEILAALLPRNISVQMFRALLENAASEQGARMSAMDNATRNAGEMIKKQTHDLQPLAPGHDHQGTDRDHLGRRSALSDRSPDDVTGADTIERATAAHEATNRLER